MGLSFFLASEVGSITQELVQPCNNLLPVEGCILNGVVDTTKTLATCVVDPTLADQEAVYCHACDSDDGCHLAQYSTNKPNAVIHTRNEYDNTPLGICTTYLPGSEGCVVNDNVETSITKDQCVPSMTSIISDRKEYTYCEGAGATYYRKERTSLLPSLKHICNIKIPDETDAGCVEHDGNDYYVSQRSKDECTPDWTTSNEKVFLYCDNCNSEAGCDIGKHWQYDKIVLAPNCGAFPPDANDATTHYCLTSNPVGKDSIAPGVSHDMQTTNIISVIFDHDEAVKACTLTASAYWCDGSLESVEASSTGVPEQIKNQIIAGVTKDEVPASVVEAIEAEAA
ncbi:MAG: hypothetical protein CL967_05500, partial [Euryarchaeota archaeon]|nr:hypothetical protein [Euryarchaeota archaeon]